MNLCLFWMGLVPPRQLFALKDESVCSNGLKGSFSILGNAFLDFKELACSHYSFFFFFPLVLHSRHASFPKQKVFFMNVQTLLSYCQCVYLQCRERKVVYLPICVRMCCLRAYSQQWICRACSVLFAASGGHASGWLLPKRNFDGLNVP